MSLTKHFAQYQSGYSAQAVYMTPWEPSHWNINVEYSRVRHKWIQFHFLPTWNLNEGGSTDPLTNTLSYYTINVQWSKLKYGTRRLHHQLYLRSIWVTALSPHNERSSNNWQEGGTVNFIDERYEWLHYSTRNCHATNLLTNIFSDCTNNSKLSKLKWVTRRWHHQRYRRSI